MGNKIVDAQKIIVPEICELIEMRYNLLMMIKSNQPIGRRNLASALDVSERLIRNEIDFLHQQKLVSVERQGVMMTSAGEQMVLELEKMLYIYNGLEQVEHELATVLDIQKVFILPGNSAQNELITELMGRKGANYILSVLGEHDIMAVSGGKSTAAVASQMRDVAYPKVCVIPARGGIGRSHSVQANNVAAEMALKLHADYELLHIPDNIDDELLSALKEYPEIKRVFDKMNETKVFVFGIGRADELAESRNLSQGEKEQLRHEGAVAEAFGYYFNIEGETVIPSGSIGISLEQYKKIPHVIAVAGGAAKAEAIIAAARINPRLVLVTDENAAKAIIRKYKFEA